jgi:hypothetical protein
MYHMVDKSDVYTELMLKVVGFRWLCKLETYCDELITLYTKINARDK